MVEVRKREGDCTDERVMGGQIKTRNGCVGVVLGRDGEGGSGNVMMEGKVFVRIKDE